MTTAMSPPFHVLQAPSHCAGHAEQVRLALRLPCGRGFLHSYRKVPPPLFPSFDGSGYGRGSAACCSKNVLFPSRKGGGREPTPSLPSPHSASTSCADAHTCTSRSAYIHEHYQYLSSRILKPIGLRSSRRTSGVPLERERNSSYAGGCEKARSTSSISPHISFFWGVEST